jgi:hypothetical protein
MSYKMALAVSAFALSLSGSANVSSLFISQSQANTYNVNISDTTGNISAIGTITTDGTLGVLSASNITDWNITLTVGPIFTAGSLRSSVVLGPPSGGPSYNLLFLIGTSLMASPTSLSFNFESILRSRFEY